VRRPARHRLDPVMTRRERFEDWWAKAVCRIVGHTDPERRFSGAQICHRCRTGLGRWR